MDGSTGYYYHPYDSGTIGTASWRDEDSCIDTPTARHLLSKNKKYNWRERYRRMKNGM